MKETTPLCAEGDVGDSLHKPPSETMPQGGRPFDKSQAEFQTLEAGWSALAYEKSHSQNLFSCPVRLLLGTGPIGPVQVQIDD